MPVAKEVVCPSFFLCEGLREGFGGGIGFPGSIPWSGGGRRSVCFELVPSSLTIMLMGGAGAGLLEFNFRGDETSFCSRLSSNSWITFSPRSVNIVYQVEELSKGGPRV